VVLMNTDTRWLGLDEAASACGLDALVIRYYAELGVVAPQEVYGPAEVAELRRVLALQVELRRLEIELRAARQWRAPEGIEAEWRDLEPE
jgi:hypothetical protein